MFIKLKSAIYKWWEGELQLTSLSEMFEDDRPEEYKRHWSATIARLLWSFWVKHWVALFAIIISVVALFK